MKINKGIIKYILSESENFENYKKYIATHKAGEGRAFVKLLYYRKSDWEEVDEKDKNSKLIVNANTKNVFDDSQDRNKLRAEDRVIPFVVVLNSWNEEKYPSGSIQQVKNERVTGLAYNPDYLAMADLIKKNRNTQKGKVLLEMNAPEAKMEALERHWGVYRIQNPWFVTDENTKLEDQMLYLVNFSEFVGEGINLDVLKSMLDEEE